MQADLEELARRTWHRTRWGWALKCHQGEETFTDINLLDLMRWSTRHRVLKTSKQDEKHKGTDWEWFIRHRGVWRSFAVQAKKVSPSGRYDALHHPVKGSSLVLPGMVIPQIDVLELYSKLTGAAPLYVLFNHDPTADATTWHCHLSLSSEQLGCSVADLTFIRTALGTYGGRFFTPIHQGGAAPGDV
ncbi:DUF6615 family protein [Deinococcus multiflagellatus]|uniref:DUF6615 family protein n=1 Tax=Deinococcus multiflagellatus TaxID=1656887 RepID=A0ABW1ZSU2_9DEIO